MRVTVTAKRRCQDSRGRYVCVPRLVADRNNHDLNRVDSSKVCPLRSYQHNV
jgi:hypothetical protein